ncbi:glycoside hydrolase family 140 protein [Pseudonocardia sichuanensis]
MRAWAVPVAAALLCAAWAGPAEPAPRSVAHAQEQPLAPVRVSDDGRFFVHADGTPFFWLADTAWSIFVNLDRAEVERYLDTRAAQGFTVIQAVAVFPQAGGPGPNRYGHDPLAEGMTPAVSDSGDDYWDHVDFVIDAAAERGLRIGLLPVWADKQAGELVTAENAGAYGEFLGARYRDRVVWIMGGDSGADGVEDVWCALAEGVAVGANGRPDHAGLLMTYHPRGDQTSAEWFHDDEWLSFNMLQGGHCRRWDNLLGLIEGNYARTPPKPFLDGESIYEDHPICWKPEDGFSTPEDVRRNAYWSVFGGAAGHTYGHHAVWQFLTEDGDASLGARGTWTEALDFPAGQQMRHLRALVESRPYLTRIPDQSVVDGSGVRATRDADGSYLMAYTTDGAAFAVDTTVLTGDALRAWWFDPRTGTATDAGTVERGASVEFGPPEETDWVLVVDDAARGFGPPGS